jgi:putative beta-lysine N-acetyltransferase
MYDMIEKIDDSIIQHGKSNNRIYLMKLAKDNYPDIIEEIENLAEEENYTKIFAKVPSWAKKGFENEGYVNEAEIPNFYNGKINTYFFSKFIKESRSKISEKEEEKIKKNINLAETKKDTFTKLSNNPSFHIRVLKEADIENLSELYDLVFQTYPFPIFNKNYIKETMKDNIVYFGAFFNNQLVAASSAEMDEASANAEMTDFATNPEYAGNNLSLLLLHKMEIEMKKKEMKTLYTIARSFSPGMNITFAKLGYEYSGTLINNTNISGKIESMNVWYKSLI